MQILNLLIQYILNVYQTFPQTIPFFGIYYGLLTINYWLIAFGISAVFSNLMNKILKTILKFIYNAYGNTSLPLLGLGTRPPNATNCSAFTNCSTCHLKSSSFGMPSGHSQIGWFFFIYGTLYIAEHIQSKFNTHKSIHEKRIWFAFAICFLFIMAITMSISRVYLNCHTIQQVIVGGIIGICLGLLSYWISAMIIYNDKHINIFTNAHNVFS